VPPGDRIDKRNAHRILVAHFCGRNTRLADAPPVDRAHVKAQLRIAHEATTRMMYDQEIRDGIFDVARELLVHQRLSYGEVGSILVKTAKLVPVGQEAVRAEIQRKEEDAERGLFEATAAVERAIESGSAEDRAAAGALIKRLDPDQNDWHRVLDSEAAFLRK